MGINARNPPAVQVVRGRGTIHNCGVITRNPTRRDQAPKELSVSRVRIQSLFLALMLLASTFATTVSAQNATPAASPVAETVLYEAADERAFGEWEMTRGWSVQDGMLIHNERINRSTILAPASLGTADYAIELEAWASDWNSYFGAFGVTVRAGTEFEISGSVGPREGVAVWIGNEEVEWDKELLAFPDSGWLTLRLEVEGTSIRLLLNGSVAIDMTDDRIANAEPGQAAIWSYPNVTVEIRRFRIIEL
jgi:hypothetical protein